MNTDKRFDRIELGNALFDQIQPQINAGVSSDVFESVNRNVWVVLLNRPECNALFSAVVRSQWDRNETH